MMKTKSLSRIFSVFLLVFMLMGMLGSMTSVFAASEKLTDVGTPIIFAENYKNDVNMAIYEAYLNGVGEDGSSPEKITISDGKITSDMIAYVKVAGGKGDKAFTPLFGLEGKTFYVNSSAFKTGEAKQVKKMTQAFVDSLKDSSMPDDQQQSFMQELQDVDSNIASVIIPMLFDSTKADLFTAYKWLYPFLSVLRVVFGIGAVLIILLLMGSTIMDLAYIGLPMWREAQAEKQGNGKHPFGVSYEALRTVEEIEKGMGDSYKNAYVLYFKRRALTYVVLAICLLYLVAGELGGLISWLLNLGSGVVS